jgi:putative flippase GtrA
MLISLVMFNLVVYLTDIVLAAIVAAIAVGFPVNFLYNSLKTYGRAQQRAELLG